MNVVDNDNVTAEMFNAYFASVFTKEREVVPDAANMCSNNQEVLKTCNMATGIVPEDWRIANVAVIHKKGPKKECGNYRPASLTSQVSKVLETLVRDAILDHLYSKKLIRDTQHGFTKRRTCLTNLLKFLEEVTAYVDEGSPVDVLYLDISKKFDKIPHKRLVKKDRK